MRKNIIFLLLSLFTQASLAQSYTYNDTDRFHQVRDPNGERVIINDEYKGFIFEDAYQFMTNRLQRDLTEEELQILEKLPENIIELQKRSGVEITSETYQNFLEQTYQIIVRLEEKKNIAADNEERLKQEESRPRMNNDFDSVRTKAYRTPDNQNHYAAMLCVSAKINAEIASPNNSLGGGADAAVCLSFLDQSLYSLIFTSPQKAINVQLAVSVFGLIVASDIDSFDGRYEGIRAGASFKLGAEGGYYSNPSASLVYLGARYGIGFMLNDSSIELHRIAGY